MCTLETYHANSLFHKHPDLKCYWLEFFHNVYLYWANYFSIFSIYLLLHWVNWVFFFPVLLEMSRSNWWHYSFCRCLTEVLIVCYLKLVQFFWWLLYSQDQTLNNFVACIATLHAITAHSQKWLLPAESFSSESARVGSIRENRLWGKRREKKTFIHF